jgi:hypothetical protein
MNKTVKLTIGIVVLGTQILWAQNNSVVDELNSIIKKAGISNGISVDSSLMDVCQKLNAPASGLGKKNEIKKTNTDVVKEYRENLWNKHIYDYDIKVLEGTGKTKDEAIKNMTDGSISIENVLSDKEYTRFGYSEQIGNSASTIQMVASKRYIEFDKEFSGSGAILLDGSKQLLFTIAGVSLLDGISYKIDTFKSLDDIKPDNTTPVELDSKKHFTITLEVTDDLQKSGYGGVAFFDKQNRVIAIVKL